jgi:hypothetical protein
MILKRTSLVKFLFFVFLLLHAIPLVFNENYQLIIIFTYSIILFSLIVSSFNNKNMSPISIMYISLIGISLTMSSLGFSGTISSLIMAASLPHFLFSNLNSEKDFLQLFYQPIMLSSFLLILFSAYLYTDVQDILGISYLGNNVLEDFSKDQLGEYFIRASINYVPLVFFSFSVLLYLLVRTKIKHIDNKRFHSLFLILLVLLTIFYSSIFLTRSVFVCSFILLYVCLNKKTRILIVLITPIIVFYNIDVINTMISNFFYTGSSTILEILSDYRRADSITNLINSSLSFNFDFRNQVSYSSFINLLFSLFPLTLVFLYSPFNTLIRIFKKRDISWFVVFLSCFMLVIYQMDFFSIFTFFFFMEYIKFFMNEKYAS